MIAITATAIDTEITSYLPLLNERQKEAVLIVIKTFAQKPLADDYNEEFMNELNSRFVEYETGASPASL